MKSALTHRVIFCALVATASTVARLSADQVQLRILTDPPGASVVLGGKAFGLSPATAKLEMGKNFVSGKRCGYTEPVVVTWASGVEARVDRIDLCGVNGKKQEITFLRPSGLPGREIDATFALQVQQLAVAKQQAALDAYRTYLAGQRPLVQPLPLPPAPIACRSELRLGVVYTTCQ